MKKIKVYAICILALALSACTADTDSSTFSAIQTEETEEWKYDGSQTVTASKKEEFVTVQADAEGEPVEITVDTNLTGIDSTDVIQDETDLSDIKNKNGDEQFEIQDGTVYWQNLGNDISYSGISNSQLPVNVKVKYYLDDEEIRAEEIAGKSGKVKIRFEYTNNTTYEDVHVPFVCMSVLMLDTDKFTNIEVTNGEVSLMDDNAIVIGYAMPSLKEDLDLSSYEDLKEMEIPEEVEVEADVDNFSLDFTETLITTGLFGKVDDADLEDLSEMCDEMNDLSESGDELADAADSLSDGFKDIQKVFIAYLDGMEEISSGMSELAEGSKELSDGIGTFAQYVKTFSDALNSVDLDDASISETITVIETDLSTILTAAQSISDLSVSCNQLTTALNDVLNTNTSLTEEEKQKIITDFENSQSYTDLSAKLSDLYTQLSSALSDIETKLDGMDISKLSDIKTSFQNIQKLTKSVSESITALENGSSALTEGISQMDQGVNEAVKNNETIKDALAQYQSALSSFSSGISKLNTEGLQKISEEFGEDGSKLVSSFEKLKEADASYRTFTKLNEDQDGSVIFMIETDKISE